MFLSIIEVLFCNLYGTISDSYVRIVRVNGNALYWNRNENIKHVIYFLFCKLKSENPHVFIQDSLKLLVICLYAVVLGKVFIVDNLKIEIECENEGASLNRVTFTSMME